MGITPTAQPAGPELELPSTDTSTSVLRWKRGAFDCQSLRLINLPDARGTCGYAALMISVEWGMVSRMGGKPRERECSREKEVKGEGQGRVRERGEHWTGGASMWHVLPSQSRVHVSSMQTAGKLFLQQGGSSVLHYQQAPEHSSVDCEVAERGHLLGTAEQRRDLPSDHKPDAQMVKTLARDPLCKSARATITKGHGLGALNNTFIFS